MARSPEIHIVYDGVGLAGKTSSMKAVHRRLANTTPIRDWHGRGGARGIEFSASSAKLTLVVHAIVGANWSPPDWQDQHARADTIVFVVDSQTARIEASEERRDLLEASFAQMGAAKPIVLQFNKRDIVAPSRDHGASIASIDELSRSLNRWGGPEFPTVAKRDEGVWEAFEAAALLAGRARGVEEDVRELLSATRPPCVNHPDCRSTGRCRGCTRDLCDACMPMLVDDEPACEPCARRAAGTTGPRWRRGLAAAALTWGPLTLLWFLIRDPYFFGLLPISYGASALFIWHQLSPRGGALPPRVRRRIRGP